MTGFWWVFRFEVRFESKAMVIGLLFKMNDLIYFLCCTLQFRDIIFENSFFSLSIVEN